MAIEELKVTTAYVDDNALSIKPELEEAKKIIGVNDIKDNSIYKITISNLKDKETGIVIPDQIIEIRTAYSPMYCSLESLKLLVDAFDIPDNNMRSYIRDASKYADYVAGGKAVKNGKEPSFAVEQFVRTKATLDCLLRTLMSRSTSLGNTYKLDTVTYKDSVNHDAFGDLIDALKKELGKWQDAVRGYFPEGRVKPKATRVGITSGSNTSVSYTTVDNILQDISRTVPQWS